ncbi:MAG TPA: hypothetical protein GYA07_02055 [Verrucomicrobia bacterium]|nr:hypothetical protein [Verrucomicrobiota bacterium]HOP96056.1 hypothetical protein [Verrucomicrobiota bacterium]
MKSEGHPKSEGSPKAEIREPKPPAKSLPATGFGSRNSDFFWLSDFKSRAFRRPTFLLTAGPVLRYDRAVHSTDLKPRQRFSGPAPLCGPGTFRFLKSLVRYLENPTTKSKQP